MPPPNHFLALRPDQDARDRLAAVAERLRAWELPARWVHPDDYHLTLAFLGPVAEAEASLLHAALDEVAGSQRRPALALTGLGAGGGGEEAPKYVYAAVGDPEAGCAAIRADLCAALDLRPEPAFRPHITLCRPQPRLPALPLFRDWPHLLEAHGLAEWGACGTDAIVLYRSSGIGATRYEALERWPLAR